MKSLKSYEIKDRTTGNSISENQVFNPRYIPTADLEVVYDYTFARRKIQKALFNFQSFVPELYLPLLPLKRNGAERLFDRVSLHEGRTPLYKSIQIGKDLGIKKLYFKYEGANPTGSFKDRGSLVEVVKALQHDAKAIILASTGNMAASVSAYSARAKLPCYVVVPAITPAPKLAQAIHFGAHVVKIEGIYDDAVNLTIEVAERKNFYLAGDYLFRQEGQKSQAYEICSQLGYKSPDWIFIPVGNGTNISAIWRGFIEFQKMGFIEKVPRIVGVQSDKYDIIVRTYHNNSPLISDGGTISTAIAVKNPSDMLKVIDLIKESKGDLISVSDDEAIESRQDLSMNESLFVEPSSAVTLAALKKCMENGRIKPNDTVVLLMTGSGLKDPISGLQLLENNVALANNFEQFEKNVL